MKLFIFLLFLAINANKELEKTIKVLEGAVEKKQRKLGQSLESSISSLSPFKLKFSPLVPPPPPVFALGNMPVQATYHIIQYPKQPSTPWNLFNYPQINNPYYGHLWPHHPLHGSAYGYMPFGLHPFMFPSLGAYGMNPLSQMNPMFSGMNPYMNPMQAMASLNHQQPNQKLEGGENMDINQGNIRPMTNNQPMINNQEAQLQQKDVPQNDLELQNHSSIIEDESHKVEGEIEVL